MTRESEITRRKFLGRVATTGSAVLASSCQSPALRSGTPTDLAAPPIRDYGAAAATSLQQKFADARADFPRATRKLWLAASETHPFNVNTLRALEDYAAYRALGPGDGRQSFTSEMQNEAKSRFAGLIGASPDELAFVLSTTDGENVVVAGLDLEKKGGNIVIDDLHFAASEYLYTMLEKLGHIELRVVNHKNWQIDIEDMAAAIDTNTRLVSMALVSNINGYMHQVKAISDLAHERGALVYGDIIQGVGCCAIDVKAMGIDCCASSSYKWLMGDFGLGFLYVDRRLHGEAIKQTRYGLRQVRMSGGGFEPKEGAAGLYEGTTTFSYLSGVAVLEGLRYIDRLGIPAIRAHAKELTDRLQREMPALGYPSITPSDNPTPIVSFLTSDPDATRAKLDRAFGEHVVSIRNWHMTGEDGERKQVTGMRCGISVYNNDEDIDAFLAALA